MGRVFRSIQRHITAAVFTVLGLNALANTTPQAWRCQANQMGAWSCSQPNPEPAPTPTTPALAQKTQPSPQTLTPDALSKLLGWIPEKGASCNACAGHYASPPFPRGEKGNEPIDAVPSKVSSDNSSYQMKGQAVLDGHVYVEQPGRRLYADHAEISQAENGKAQRIHAWGNLKVREPQTMVIAHELKADLFTHNAELSNPIYLMELQPRFIGSIVEDTNFTGYAHGQADVVYQRNRNVFDFYHATYTTCPPMKSTWLLHANHIRIDRTQQRGYATNMWLTSHDIPFFYLPYFSFPITKSRQSGFLYGSIGGDFDHGFSLSAPYYFNLAPNYDDTFTPTWYQGRGILWDDQFRFLSQSTIANLDVQYIRDQKTGDASNRGLASYSQTTQLSENWELSALYNYVSDKAYLSDFQNLSGGGLTTAADATELATEANTTVLESSLQLNYSGPHWHWANEFRDYEIVDRTLNLNNRPYNLLPQMNLTGQFPNRFAPFNVDWDAQYTFFQKSEDNGATPINAQRFHIDPAISLPMQRSYGYFTPQVRLAATDYNLLHNQGTSYTENHPSRVLPIATLDTAGYLDRDFAFLHQVYEQTVKPRLRNA
ncbi:MAG: LPS-assembly protein LptD, partial [Gammaproteobacteria bacterium]|nr:LPS-assembly protein LptD [Gammaproteobacteria bacterium]